MSSAESQGMFLPYSPTSSVRIGNDKCWVHSGSYRIQCCGPPKTTRHTGQTSMLRSRSPSTPISPGTLTATNALPLRNTSWHPWITTKSSIILQSSPFLSSELVLSLVLKPEPCPHTTAALERTSEPSPAQTPCLAQLHGGTLSRSQTLSA